MDFTDSPTFEALSKIDSQYDLDNSREINEYYNRNEELKNAFSISPINTKKAFSMSPVNTKKAFSMSPVNTKIIGFTCQNENCTNREAVYGTIFLPYCDENINCMKKNLEYLLLENSNLKGRLQSYN